MREQMILETERGRFEEFVYNLHPLYLSKKSTPELTC